MIAAPSTPREPPSHPRAWSGRCSPPRKANIIGIRVHKKLAAVPLGLGFVKVAGDTGFCRGRVCERGRCRPGISWHILKHFSTDSFANEVSGAKRKSDFSVIQIPISRHFDQIRGSIICAKHGPIQIGLHFTGWWCLCKPRLVHLHRTLPPEFFREQWQGDRCRRRRQE